MVIKIKEGKMSGNCNRHGEMKLHQIFSRKEQK